MRDVVNARRLARSCGAIVATESPTRRDVKRLQNYVSVLRQYVDNLQRMQMDGERILEMENHELVELSQKLVIFETFVKEHQYALQKGEARPEAPPLTRQASEQRLRERVSSMNNDTGSPKPIENADLTSHLRNEYTEQTAPAQYHEQREELLGRTEAPPSSFADFMAGHGTSANAVEDQLRQMEEEQELLKDDVSKMVGNLRHRLLGINDNLQTDKRNIDMVSDRADKSLDTLSAMTQRLNITLATSSYNCKMCTVGVFIVLALWVFAYLVMRIFPKVK